MPNFATRAKAKLERGWRKLATPCQFIPASGEAYQRGANLLPTQADLSQEYLQEPIPLVEFLKADGPVDIDDEFQLDGTTYTLGRLYEHDELTVTFVYR